MSFRIARKLASLIMEDEVMELIRILDCFSPEETQEILSITVNRSSLLFLAIAVDNLHIISYLLQDCYANPNSTGWMNGKKMTCLYLAVELNMQSTTELLLIHGARFDESYQFQGSALFRACQYEDTTIAYKLIDHGADVNNRDYTGESCLMESTGNYELFKHLIAKGADINWSCFAQSTVLMNALLEGENSLIFYLLVCDNLNVRVRTETEEDAFNIAVRCNSDSIIQAICRKGLYTELEVLRVYEMECCFFRIRENEYEAKELWLKIVRIRGLPWRTPIFQNPNPVGYMVRARDFLRADDCAALSYLETFCRYDRKFLMQVFVHATLNMRNKSQIPTALRFLIQTMNTLSDDDYFMCSIQPKSLIERLFDECNSRDKKQLFRIYIIFVMEYIRRYNTKTVAQKDAHTYQVECLFYDILRVLYMIWEAFPTELDLFYSDIKGIVQADLYALYGKSIVQVAIRICTPLSIVKILINSGIDLYRKDKLGRTLIHDIVEYRHGNKTDLIQFLLDKGLNLDYITNYDYCIPCFLKANDILPNAESFLTLQCRIVRMLYESTFPVIIPDSLKNVINMHLHLFDD